MAEKKLARYVTVAGTTYGPGDTLPKDVADAVTNPKAFEEPDDRTPAQVVADRQREELVKASDDSGSGSRAAKA